MDAPSTNTAKVNSAKKENPSQNKVLVWEAVLPQIEELAHNFDMNNLLRAPARPEGIELDITRLNLLSNEQLGVLLGYYSGMFAFVNAQYSILDAQFSAVKENFEIAMNLEIYKVESQFTDKRRPLKDGLIGMALDNNENLKITKMKEIELEAKARVAKGFATSWDVLYQAVSREVSRRAMEINR
jgi:hypothetical protein